MISPIKLLILHVSTYFIAPHITVEIPSKDFRFPVDRIKCVRSTLNWWVISCLWLQYRCYNIFSATGNWLGSVS